MTLYINNTDDEVLTEVIEYDLEGMEIEGLSGERNINVQVLPGQEQMIKLVNISNRGDVERKLSSTVKNTVVKPYKPPKQGEDSDAMEATGPAAGGFGADARADSNEDDD